MATYCIIVFGIDNKRVPPHHLVEWANIYAIEHILCHQHCYLYKESRGIHVHVFLAWMCYLQHTKLSVLLHSLIWHIK